MLSSRPLSFRDHTKHAQTLLHRVTRNWRHWIFKYLLLYRGADKSLARPTSRCISFDGQNISFDTNTNISQPAGPYTQTTGSKLHCQNRPSTR
jgi:hypothetical protein